MNRNPIFIAFRVTECVKLDNALGTDKAELYSAPVTGCLIESIAVTSTDTSAVELDMFMTDLSETHFALGSVTIPAGAGTDGGTTPAVSLLNPTDLPWLRDDGMLPIGYGWILSAAPHAAITSGKVVHITILAGEY